MNLRQRAALIFLLISAPSAYAQTHRVVRITEPDAIRPAEVAVAINPANPDNIVAASFQLGRPPQPRVSSYVYVTMDGGQTWKTIANPNPQSLVQGDDAITFGGDGAAYHVNISFEGIRVVRPKRAESGILVSASRDGVQTWGEPVPVINHINSVTPFEDKPAIVTDNANGSPSKGNVYLAWTRFDIYGSTDPECHSQIYFSRSTDGGKTFAMPFRISDVGGDCRGRVSLRDADTDGSRAAGATRGRPERAGTENGPRAGEEAVRERRSG